MEEKLIAPCGMNCALCVHYQFGEKNLNRLGFHKKYCPGCIPRGKNCLFLGGACARLANGELRFCHLCENFPCKRLKALDKRYRTKYGMSMIDNLRMIKECGMDAFLASQEEAWRCERCGTARCCHNGLCLACDAEALVRDKKLKREK